MAEITTRSGSVFKMPKELQDLLASNPTVFRSIQSFLSIKRLRFPIVRTAGQVYRVAEDAFVVVRISGSDNVQLLNDNVNPPTTVKAEVDSTDADKNTITYPVRKNTYYKVTDSGTSVVSIEEIALI